MAWRGVAWRGVGSCGAHLPATWIPLPLPLLLTPTLRDGAGAGAGAGVGGAEQEGCRRTGWDSDGVPGLTVVVIIVDQWEGERERERSLSPSAHLSSPLLPAPDAMASACGGAVSGGTLSRILPYFVMLEDTYVPLAPERNGTAGLVVVAHRRLFAWIPTCTATAALQGCSGSGTSRWQQWWCGGGPVAWHEFGKSLAVLQRQRGAAAQRSGAAVMSQECGGATTPVHCCQRQRQRQRC
jgi:hypothetical protein